MLKFNEEALKKAKEVYQEQAQRMRDLRTALTAAVDGIREGWDSAAGDEFFKKYDMEWLHNIDNYIDVIQHMSENMDTADNRYRTAYDETEGVKLHQN